jgi:LysM repeat protein
MKWRHWRILVILVLLSYLAFCIALTRSSQEQLYNPPPTRTPQPTFESIERGPVVLRVMPTNTARPTRNLIPAATQTAAALPSLIPTNTPTRTPSPQPTATPAAETITHAIGSGDTLLGIAQRYGTTVEAIIEANDLADPNLILIGQALIIPVATQTADTPAVKTITHTIERGDTMLGIAQRYGTTVDAIVGANDLANPDLIFPGQILIIPTTP